MAIDPEVQALLAQMAQADLPELNTLSPAQARAMGAAMAAVTPPGPAIFSVENTSLQGRGGSIPLRIYHGCRAPKAVIVYYHGGGWVLGSLDSHDPFLRGFALTTETVIVSVDYRLAPEFPFPAAVEDAWDALAWAAHADFAGAGLPLLVAGDSAGGNLAAIAAIQARDAGAPLLAAQILFYPATDADFTNASYRENGEGFFLTTALMEWFWDHYLPDPGGRADPLASPLRHPDLSRLPETLIQTAEYDPLRDEGEAYAARLQAAGGAITLQRRAGLIHGYLSMELGVAAARAAVQDAVSFVRQVIGGHTES